MPKNYLFLLLVCVSNICYSQSKPAGPVVATPNAASLGLYGEIPVSYFTGLPGIELPVYTIQERGLSFPITMSYHAQGFKPDVHPSWVGANWTLNFGGAITRKMNKLPDEWKSNDYNLFGYYYSHDRLNNPNWSSTDTLLAMGNPALSGSFYQLDRLDREPDEFNFNFLGFSGKFYLDHMGKWRVQSNKNLRVVCTEADIIYPFFHNSVPNTMSFTYFLSKVFGRFTLIDDQGIQYIFGKTENTDAIEYSSGIAPPDNNYRLWLIATSWYLAEIKLPDGTGYININYERGPFQSSFQYFESQNRFFVSRCVPGSTGSSNFDAKSLSGTITSPVYATDIFTTSGIRVEFKFSKSNELAYPSGTYFEVFRDDQGRLPSQQSPPQTIPEGYFNFMQARGSVPYYVANGIWADGIISSNKFAWFKLDSLVLSNWDLSNGMAKTAFKRVVFNYRENASERLKLLSLDFKGAEPGNESGLFSLKYNDWGAAAPAYVSDLTDHWGFANRQPLKKDPLYGGYTWFGGSMLANRAPDETGVRMDMLTEIAYPTGGKTIFEYEGNEYGKYLLNNTRNYAPPGSGKAGGLRIKKITNEDGLGNMEAKEFFYVNGYDPNVPLTSLSSSGILDGKPATTHYNYTLTANGQYLSLYSSNAIVPVSGNSGAICGYSEVTEKKQDGSYKIYKFTNHDNGYTDQDAIVTITPYELGVPFRSRSFERGQLLSEEIFSAANKLVQKTEYSYVRIGAGADSNFIRSLKKEFGGYCTSITPLNPYVATISMGYGVPMLNGFFADPSSFNPTYTTATAYGYYTYKFLPEKITQKIYPSPGQQGLLLTTETMKYYDMSGNLIQTTQTDSKGETAVTNFKYPYHFTGMPVYDAMISRGMTGSVIESEALLSGKLIGKEKTNYGFFNGTALIKPASISKQNGTGTPYTTIQFNKYDEFGNILELQASDGIKNAYVWSYFKSRPVAKVAGADYASIQPLINQQVLSYPYGGEAQLLAEVDKIRIQIPSAVVSTFLYDSKSDWGMKQLKDANGFSTYYEYDMMGRLVKVRDNNNKILTQLEYKYKDIVSFPFRNAERSQVFDRTNCPAGYAGAATYVVAANKYGSFISQADADQKAQDDINANGQAYANTTGACYPYWSYMPCCGFGSVYSNFALTDTGSVTFSLIITKNPPGGGSSMKIGTLSGPLFLPSANRNIGFSTGGSTGGTSGMITITKTGEVRLSGSIGTEPLQITGTYVL